MTRGRYLASSFRFAELKMRFPSGGIVMTRDRYRASSFRFAELKMRFPSGGIVMTRDRYRASSPRCARLKMRFPSYASDLLPSYIRLTAISTLSPSISVVSLCSPAKFSAVIISRERVSPLIYSKLDVTAEDILPEALKVVLIRSET